MVGVEQRRKCRVRNEASGRWEQVRVDDRGGEDYRDENPGGEGRGRRRKPTEKNKIPHNPCNGEGTGEPIVYVLLFKKEENLE